jgi:hypothetical protein
MLHSVEDEWSFVAKIFVPLEGFEPVISVVERSQT